jgi:multiple sugar transport system permease protein
MKKSLTFNKIIMYVILIFLSGLFLLPLVWMVSTSLKYPPQIHTYPPTWIPNPIAWSNYPNAVKYMPFLRYIRNTLYYCVFTVIGVTLSSTLVAYSLSRLNWPGKNILFIITLAVMMLPGQVTVIPIYIFFHRLGWINTYKPLIIPTFFGNAFYIFLLRQFLMTIPKELSDAAYVDGASEIQILIHIISPLVKPAILVVILFQFLGAWKDFFGPLIYLSKEELYPISLGLQNYLSAHGHPEWGFMMAAAVLTTLPIIVLFFFTQRQFIEGITLTGLKM